MKKIFMFLIYALLLISGISLYSQSKKTVHEPDSLKNISLSGLQFRLIGPAITGGRIRDIAVNPDNNSEYYVASGSGSLWKTTNNGITFSPVFDNNNTYAVGAVEIDPSNTNIIWVGTGENSNHNNVVYGDGIYKSEDGGKTWKNTGLNTSEHIGGIAVDPKNSSIVLAAAMGSLRRKGGDRGIFKTTDGGQTWRKVLSISEYTGCYEVHMDPRYSNIVYAVAHQRMRNLYTGVSGGPESGIYKSIDSGETWQKLGGGLPSGDVGRIGMSVSPVNPDVLYAVVEAKNGQGTYKSVDRGASWTMQSSYVSSYLFYFQKIYCDTKDVDRVYSMDVFLQVTKDGGKTWSNLGEKNKHVDNHAMWIDAENNSHLIVGCDGGVYESYDQGLEWDFKCNIPIAEIYKITADNSLPFYNVYIGTQDNNSLGGPSRTINSGGITNQDWFFTLGGDGFQSQVDWKDPNIIYAQSQNGGLVKYDKRTGEKLYIRPYDFADTSYRFDWDTPLLISQHNNNRLYFGGNKLFRSDDQGSTWREVSPDLTRGVPQKMQNLMDRSWSIDELTNKSSMAFIGSIAESIIDENILFVGSCDGLIHFTTDGGNKWIKSQPLPGLPEYARIHQIIASQFNKLIAYAACHNFTEGDYKPYIYKTTDGGKSWFSINNNLPELGSTYSIAEDHVDEKLLFTGTQFGVYFTNNGGEEWLLLNNGMPKVCVMNLLIQKRENDLVASTYGRSVYILDDYSPLRYLNKETIKKDAFIFPVKDALMFIPATPFGYGGIGSMGSSFYAAPNPEVGAVFTYFIKDQYKSLKEKRRETEKEIQKKSGEVEYPSYDQLKKEREEQPAFLLFTITDQQGGIVRRIKTDIVKGVNRLVWDFRYGVTSPVSFETFDASIPWNEPERGYMVAPGKFFVSISRFENGQFSEVAPPQEFVCKKLFDYLLKPEDEKILNEFNVKVADLARILSGVEAFRRELESKLSYIKKAVLESGKIPLDNYNEVLKAESELKDFNRKLNGDPLRARYEGGTPTSIKERIDLITSALWSTTSAPTATFIKSYNAAYKRVDEVVNDLKSIENHIKQIESVLDKYGAPYTPGRFN